MSENKGTVYLLADSEPLFRDGAALPARMLAGTAGRAAYVGAANGDEPVFFEIFCAAMQAAGASETRHVRAQPTDEDLAYLDAADVILLSGGDVEQGMRALDGPAFRGRIDAAHRRGAAVVGVSAGAVQLGAGWCEPGERVLRAGLGVLPMVVSVHEQPDWPLLDAAVRAAGGYTPGIGVAKGGAVVVHPDGEIEPLFRAACEVATAAFGHRHSVLAGDAA